MYGVFVIIALNSWKFDPIPIIRSPRKYRQIYFDPLVTVLKGFHCISVLLYFAEYLKSNSYIHMIFSCQALLFVASIVKRKLLETLYLVFVHFRSARFGTLAFKLLHLGKVFVFADWKATTIWNRNRKRKLLVKSRRVDISLVVASSSFVPFYFPFYFTSVARNRLHLLVVTGGN